MARRSLFVNLTPQGDIVKKVRIGVAGLGKLGTYHIQNFMQIPAAEVTAVHDINKERGNKIAAEFGIAFREEFEDLMDSVDAVSIAVPTSHHSDLASKALAAPKPVFVEKPIAATLAQARELVRLSRENQVQLQVGHVERFNPAFTALRLEKLNPMFIEAHRLASFDPRGSDVAVVLDLMIHDIDLVRTIVGSRVERIDASGVSVISDSEDIANARLQFQNGCVANLTASRISLKKMRKMRLFQQDSYTSMDFLIGHSEVYSLHDLPPSQQGESPIPWGIIEKNGNRRQIKYEKIKAEESNALKAELSAFVACIQRGKNPVVSGEDGLRALEIAEMILEQIQIRRRAGEKT